MPGSSILFLFQFSILPVPFSVAKMHFNILTLQILLTVVKKQAISLIGKLQLSALKVNYYFIRHSNMLPSLAM